MDFKKELEIMRANYAKKPLKHLTLPVPEWLNRDDALCAIYREKEELISEGTIYYATVIQANLLLFKKNNKFNCPACLLYSPDEVVCSQPWLLKSMAFQLGSYKDKDPETVPEEWREIAHVLTDEFDRSSFEFTANSNDGVSVNMRMCTMMVYKEHLPKNAILSGLLPVLAIPGKCESILILPSDYWSKDFRKAWIKGQL